MNIVVIGGGVVGTSIAVELAERGAQVTIVDQQHLGSGTSSTSYAWVNANNKFPASYFDLNRAGLRAHRKLAENGAPWLVPTGHLEVATDAGHRARLEARVERLESVGYAVERVSIERARTIVPDLIIDESCEMAVFYPEEAFVYPSLYIGHLLDRASDLGVTIRSATRVVGLEQSGNGAEVTLEAGAKLRTDCVVSAVGRWTNELTRMIGLPNVMAEYQHPGDATVGYLAVTNPLPVTLDQLITSPSLNVRPDGGGRLRLQALDLDVSADPSAVPDTNSKLAGDFVHRLQHLLKNTGTATITELVVGQRAMPVDGYSVVGTAPAAPWLYLVATHSGITLAPVLGSGVAEEIFGRPESLFDDFRPDRLDSNEDVVLVAPRRAGEQ